MSMNHEIRIARLEKQMADLMDLLTSPSLVEEPKTSPHVRRGYQGYYVYQGDEKITEKPMKKLEAEQMAAELHG